MRPATWLLVIYAVAAGGATQAQTISTVAGSGSPGWCGDGGPAVAACLQAPEGVAVHPAGGLFIADYLDHRVRKVDASGVITTVAGNGTPSYCGDDGPATGACLGFPAGVAVDGTGNLFIADFGNRRVRKVDVGGRITTVAGSGAEGFCGDGGPATTACLTPTGVAVDPTGNLFIADMGNNRIRRVAAATGRITTVAGSGTGGFCGDGGPAIAACLNGPWGVAVGLSGTLYIADRLNQRVRRVDPAGIMTTVAGTGTYGFCGDGGPATSACLNGPYSVAVSPDGRLLIADRLNQRIRQVDGAGVISTLVGSGTDGFCGDGGLPTAACLNDPHGVAVSPTGTVYIADTDNSRIRRVSVPMLRLTKALLSGCLKTNGKVTLTAPAPAGGLIVTLRSDNPHVIVPPSVVLRAGVVTKSFSILTSAVASRETATIEADVLGYELSARLTLRPMGPKLVSLAPNPVIGGNTVGGILTLECAAGPGDILVRLTSSKPVAWPTTPWVTVPVGTQAIAFDVMTTPVPTATKPSIKATANGVTKSKALVVNPVP